MTKKSQKKTPKSKVTEGIRVNTLTDVVDDDSLKSAKKKKSVRTKNTTTKKMEIHSKHEIHGHDTDKSENVNKNIQKIKKSKKSKKRRTSADISSISSKEEAIVDTSIPSEKENENNKKKQKKKPIKTMRRTQIRAKKLKNPEQ